MQKLFRVPSCARSSTCTLELVFFLYKVGESLLDATIRPYIIQATCMNVVPDSNLTVCGDIGYYPAVEDLVQPAAAFYIMLHRITLYAPAIVLGLFFGAWSDKYGRKIPMVFPSMGSVIGVVFYIGSMMERQWNVLLIIAGGMFQGALGKSSVVTMAVHSYAADITEKEQRTKKMGKILSMNFFGLFAGSLLSGILADLVGMEVMFCVVSLFHATAILTIVFLLAETVQYKKDTPKKTFECSSFFNLANVKDSLMVVFRKREDGARSIVITIFLISILQITCKTGEMDTTVLFVQHRPLSWSKSGYGFLLSIDYAVMGVCLFFILPLLSNVLKISDTTIIIMAIFCKVARLLWAAFLNKTWMVYVSIGLGAMGGLMISALRSLLSKTVDEHEIGKTFSLLGCGETASKLLGTAIFTNIYGATAKIMPGMVYLIEAAVFFITLLMTIWVTVKLKRVLNYRLLDDASPKKNYSSQESPDIPSKSIFEPDSKPDLPPRENSVPWLGRTLSQSEESKEEEEESGKRRKGGGSGGRGGGAPVSNGRSNGGPRHERSVGTDGVVATTRTQWKTFEDDEDDEPDVNDPKFSDGDRTGSKPVSGEHRNGHLAQTQNRPQRPKQQPPPRPPPPAMHGSSLNGSSRQKTTPVMMEMKVMDTKTEKSHRRPHTNRSDAERRDYNKSSLYTKTKRQLQYKSEAANGQTRIPPRQQARRTSNDDGK